MKLTSVILFVLSASLFSSNITAQTTDSLLNKHQKNIFTLAFYKQSGKDSMVDMVDMIYRVLNSKKQRSLNNSINKPYLTLIPSVEYSLATGMSAAVKTSYIFAKAPGV